MGALAAAWLAACASSGPDPEPAPGPSPAPPGSAAPAPGGGSAAQPGGGSGRAGNGPFPSPEALEDLQGQPSPQNLFALRVRDVDSWRLSGPFPKRVETVPWTDDGPTGELLASVARRRAGLIVPTEAMHCVAREIGLFFLAHDARPSDGLRRYIRSRCNASVSNISFGYLEGRVPETASDAEVMERWGADAEETLLKQFVGGARTAGLWFGRDGERALFLAVAGQRQVHVEPVETVPGPDGRIVLEGESLQPVRAVEALVTQGELGFARCENDPSVAPPRFRFSCPARRGDDSAWVALSLLPPERLLSHTAVELLVWPKGKRQQEYRRPSYARSRRAADEAAATAGFVELLNQVRKRAGLAPLTLDEEQSRIARELAPHFFGAHFGREAPAAADLVVLGLMAGWSVQGVVQSGHFTASWVVDSDDVERLLSEALDQPAGRSALLASDVERVAVGPLLDNEGDSPSMAVVVGTYGLFTEEAHEASAKQVVDLLTRAREARGEGPPARLERLAPLAMHAAGQVQSGSDPQEALQNLLRTGGATLRRSVQGWILESNRLEDLEFPEELLSRRDVSVAVGVSSYRPQGDAWGRYVVMIVAAEPDRGV